MKKIYILILMLLCTFPFASAQTSNTNYFVRQSIDRHKLNPAFIPLNGYIGIPVAGSVYVNVNSPLAGNELFYPLQNGKIGTFLHPEVDANQFLSTLRTNNYIDLEVNTSLLTFGWFTGQNSFWTLDLSARVLSDNNIPKDFFRLLKVGMDNPETTYSISDLAVSADAYAQIALGYSRMIGENWRVGGKLKFLAAAGGAKVAIDRMDVSMNSNAWNVGVQGHGNIYLNGVDVALDEDGFPSDLTMGSYAPAGYGGAIDLGAQFSLPDVGGKDIDLTFSASVLDLGFISYGKNNVAALGMAGNTSFDGFEIDMDMTQDDIQDQFDVLMHDMKKMVGLHEEDVRSGRSVMLPTTIMAGVECSFLDDIMSVGLLYKGRNGRIRFSNEMTASYNLRPADWFGVSLSYSFLNVWNTLGWGIYLNSPYGLSLYVNSDYTFFKYNRPGLPVDDSFFSVQVGVSVPIQARKAAALRAQHGRM